MTGSSAVVLSNLAYLIGAVVLAIIGGLVVWLRHRQPRSVDANVESFHRGLRALAPDGSQTGSGRDAVTTATGGLRIQPRAAVATVEETDDHFDSEGGPIPGENGQDPADDRLDQPGVSGPGPEPSSSGPDGQPLASERPGPSYQAYQATTDGVTAPTRSRDPQEPRLARDLAIDLGTANTLVYSHSGRGIVLNEPTVIALNSRTQDVLAMGHEAWQMIGRTPGYIVAVRPLRKGAITDFDMTQRMIRLLLQRAGVSRFNRPRVLICVPSAITEVERRAVEEAARGAGANGAYLIEQPMAAAIGAGLPIHEPLGNMVVDVGGGTTETAVISLGGIVALEAIRVGSFDIDATIQTYVRREYGIAVGERTVEEIKLAIGSAWPTDNSIKAEVRGRDLMTGLPKTVILSPDEVREAIEEQVGAIVDSVVKCLGASPPELAQDLITQGIHLVGGGGLLSGLDRRLQQETSLPVILVDAPLECVVLGAGKCLEEFDAVKDLFM